jgi:hypothetical protein
VRSSVGPAWRAAYVAYVGFLRAQRSGLKIMGNVNHDCSDSVYQGLLDWGYDEGTLGTSYGTFTHGGIQAVRTRMLALKNNCIESGILHASGEDTNYARGRLGYAMAAMFDAGFSYTDQTPNHHAAYFDEYGEMIGSRVSSVPSGAAQNGIWACEFEDGLVLANPTTTSQTINVTSIGSGLWKYFSGSQAPSVNTGANIPGSITIGGLDGRILRRQV